MRVLKKSAVLLMAASIVTASSIGYMPFNSVELPAFTANAADVVKSGTCGAEEDNLKWTLDSEGTLTISGEGKMTDFVVDSPEWDIAKIKNIVIKDGVTSIGEFAFENCEALISVSIPNSVTDIYLSAFSKCKALKTVTIPDGVTSIEDSTFAGCTAMTSISIPDSIKYIGTNAFSNSGLTTVSIPKSVTSIGVNAFKDCESLTSITIKNADCIIGDVASAIPEKATIYGYTDSTAQAYAEKYDRRFISLDEGMGECGENVKWTLDNKGTLTISGEGAMENWNGENSPWYDKANIKKVVIENGVTTIGDSAFKKCSSIAEISIPDTVTSIGLGAFEYCTALTEITIPDSVTFIDMIAFSGCGLTSIEIPDSITSIGDSTFSGCKNLSSVKFSENITLIGMGAFSDCPALTSITLPKSLDSLWTAAFTLCDNLASITIENPECEIDDTSVTIPEKATIYGYTDSTAQAYATKYSRKFIALDEKPETYKLGDANGDDIIDSSDASFVLAEYADIQTGGTGGFTPEQKLAADVNKDGVIDSSDASKILAYYAMVSTGKEPNWD